MRNGDVTVRLAGIDAIAGRCLIGRMPTMLVMVRVRCRLAGVSRVHGAQGNAKGPRPDPVQQHETQDECTNPV